MTSYDGLVRQARTKWFHRNNANEGFNPKFIIPNHEWKPPVASAKIEESLAVGRREMAKQLSRIPRQLIKPNLSASMITTFKNFIDLPDIMIKPTDKNLGIAIVSTEWYTNEIQRLLSDSKTYKVSEPHMYQLEKCLTDIVKKHSIVIPEDEYKFILHRTQYTSVLPVFHILPKIHKDPIQG